MRPASKLVIVVLVLIFSAILLSSYKGQAQPQGVGAQTPLLQRGERAIMKSTNFNPPVSIKAVKTKGRSVPLDKKFTDEDDWLKGFAVLVRNDSDKTITHIGLRMGFSPVDGVEGGLGARWDLGYGANPFFYKSEADVPRSNVPSVLPGGEIELKLSDAELKDLKAFLKKVGFPETVHVVEIGVSTIGFADGTAWFGKMLKRDGVKWKRADPRGGPLNNHPRRPKGGVQRSSTGSFFFPRNLPAAFNEQNYYNPYIPKQIAVNIGLHTSHVLTPTNQRTVLHQRSFQ